MSTYARCASAWPPASNGFSFGVDEEDTFVLLQALVDTDRLDEADFVALMDKFVKTANVWTKRLAEIPDDAPPAEDESAAASAGMFV